MCMKIAIFTDTYEPQINGVVTSINDYNKQLRKHGHEVHIFCPKAHGLKKSKFIHPVKSMELKQYPSYRIGFPSRVVIRGMRKFKPDLVHIHSPGSLGLMGLTIAKTLKIPSVMTYHTLFTEYAGYLPGAKHRPVRKLGEKTIKKYVKHFYNRADLIIAPGKDTSRFLKKLVRKPVIILPTGIPLPKKILAKKQNKIPIVLQVGRLCKERSVDVVIKAFALLLKKHPAKLVITSSGPQAEELKQLTSDLGIQKNVKFTGFVSERQKNALYKKADVFVSASSTDTQGLVPIEAMSFGTPVVVTHASGFRDFITHNKNGMMFPKGNEKKLCEQLLKVIKNKSLRIKLSKQGIITSQKYDIEKLGNKLEAIYYSIIYRLI
jgi:1,2-diacylglycerol 3-alpha-glucosyltransferase